MRRYLSSGMQNPEMLRRVQWKDLTRLSVKEMLIENNLSIPWALSSWWLAYCGYYVLAFPFSVMFFLASLRQTHNAFHNALGTTKFLTWFTMYSNSILMLTAMHAIRFTHLRHHKYCLSELDFEGRSASMKWWQAILYGPAHVLLTHTTALREGSRRDRLNILFELVSIAVFVGVVVYWQIHFLLYHIVIMVVGEFLTSFFTVWVVHHDCEDEVIARTQRKWWKNALTYGMFYHLEHHLFPAVPTIKMPELAKRIDEALPELEKKMTF